jgi:hypothetical protein
VLVNNLKTASAGGVTLETVRDYVQAQGTKEQKRSATKRA